MKELNQELSELKTPEIGNPQTDGEREEGGRGIDTDEQLLELVEEMEQAQQQIPS